MEPLVGFEIGTLFGLTHHSSDGEGATVIGVPSSPTLGIPGIPSLYVSWFPVANMSVGSEFSVGRTAGDVYGITSLYFGGRGTFFPLGFSRSGLYVLCHGAVRHFDLRERPSITDFAAGGGLGYRWRLGPAFVLRAEGRYRRWFDDGVNDSSLLLGLGARTGSGCEERNVAGPLYEIGTRFGISLTLQHPSPVLSLAYCAVDGCVLASGAEDGLLYLWDPGTGELITRLLGHTGAILSTVFSPLDHHLLASGGADGSIRLWDRRSGAHQRALSGHTGTIGSLAFSFDGSVIASGSTDGSVRVWNTETGEQLGKLDHKSPVLSVAFSAGDSLFASGSADGSARLWDPLTWKVKATLGHESPVHSVSFSPEGGLLVTGAEDGNVRKWELTSVGVRFARDPANDFDSLGPARNTFPTGIWSDGTTMWVADRHDEKLYAYDVGFGLLG